MGGPDGKICGSRSGQHQMCVLAESQILSGPALPTIDDTQLGSHCSDTCLYLFQCCFEMVFWWTCPSSRLTLGGKGKKGRAQHVNVIPSIDPSSNVTDCSSVNKNYFVNFTGATFVLATHVEGSFSSKSLSGDMKIFFIVNIL